VIVAAAIIMIAVFGSFILTDDPTIKQFGVGLASAVLLAGLMVVLLAPALLTVFGKHAFWVPRWLGRILPHMDLEGPPPGSAPVTEQVVVGAAEPAGVRAGGPTAPVDHPADEPAEPPAAPTGPPVPPPATVGNGRHRSTSAGCTSARARARAATTVGVSGVPAGWPERLACPE